MSWHGKFFSTPNTYIIIVILITGAKVMIVWSFNKNQFCYSFGTFKPDQTKGSNYFFHKIWIKRSDHKKNSAKNNNYSYQNKKSQIIQQGWSLKSVSMGFPLLPCFPVPQKWSLNPSQITIHSKTQNWNRGSAELKQNTQ